MQQMPEEGKLFTQVDKYWKEIMRNTVKDPKVSIRVCSLEYHKLLQYFVYKILVCLLY